MRAPIVPLAACLGLLVIARTPEVRAQPAADDEPAEIPAVPLASRVVSRGLSLVGPTTPWRWQVQRAPQLAPQIGALAVSGLAVVAGREEAPIPVLGAGEAPAAWPFALDVPGEAALPAGTRDERISAAWGQATFTLGPADQGLAVLELRVRYQDGLAVWLNGLEVVRAALPRTPATALARRPHGPEWETFLIPVGPGVLRLGRNQLAIEVHPSGRRDAPTAAVELVGRRERGIVRGPVLAQVTPGTARVVVDTDDDTPCVLAWGAGDGGLEHRLTSAPGRHHEFTLTGLPSRGAVRYQVEAGATRATHVFQTAPRAGDVLRIGVYGDVRGGHTVHRQLVERMLAEPLDAVAVTGDMVLRGSDRGDWQRFFAITEPLLGAVPYLPAIGNHDLGWNTGGRPEAFALPPGPADRPPGAFWYSVDIADVHLVFLDSNAYERTEQEVWLDADLAAARAGGARAILAITHDGPYSRGTHRGNREARRRFAPILVRHGVDLVLSGHDHLYQRGAQDGLPWIVTGGGGASLYPVVCGAPGRPRCKAEDGMEIALREHHYLVLTIGPTTLEVCPRRPDGRLLEPCVRYPLHRR